MDGRSGLAVAFTLEASLGGRREEMGRALSPSQSKPPPLGRKHFKVSLGRLGLRVLTGPGPRLRQGRQSAWQDGGQVALETEAPGSPWEVRGEAGACSHPRRKLLTGGGD